MQCLNPKRHTRYRSKQMRFQKPPPCYSLFFFLDLPEPSKITDPTAQASLFPPHSPLSLPLLILLPSLRTAHPTPRRRLRRTGPPPPRLPSAPHCHLPSNLPPGRSPFRILLPSMRRRAPTIPAPPALPSSPATESTPHHGRLRGTGTWMTPPPRLPSALQRQLPSNFPPGRLLHGRGWNPHPAADHRPCWTRRKLLRSGGHRAPRDDQGGAVVALAGRSGHGRCPGC
jgi:hypothetical protein